MQCGVRHVLGTAAIVSLSFRLRPSARTSGNVSTLPVDLDVAADETDASFQQLYDAAFPKIYAFIRCQVANVETAQDLVSRVFVKAYRHRRNQPAEEAAMQWLFRIARTTLIDYWRVDKRRESTSLPLEEIAELPSATDNPEAAYERKQRAAEVVRVLAELNEDDRMMLAFKFAGQRTNREIAAIMSISDAAVSMRLLRALRKLRDHLGRTGWA
jgi:RNA polymerase sigma-70 factor, ECF subfamily